MILVNSIPLLNDINYADRDREVEWRVCGDIPRAL